MVILILMRTSKRCYLLVSLCTTSAWPTEWHRVPLFRSLSDDQLSFYLRLMTQTTGWSRMRGQDRNCKYWEPSFFPGHPVPRQTWVILIKEMKRIKTWQPNTYWHLKAPLGICISSPLLCKNILMVLGSGKGGSIFPRLWSLILIRGKELKPQRLSWDLVEGNIKVQPNMIILERIIII